MERVFTIPLRKAYRKSWMKRAPYAVSLIKEFIRRHVKPHPEDVKIGEYLNQEIWKRGRKHPPRRVKIKVVIDGKTAKAELLGYEYKQMKVEEKEPQGIKEKLQKRISPKTEEIKKLEDKIKGKEKEG